MTTKRTRSKVSETKGLSDAGFVPPSEFAADRDRSPLTLTEDDFGPPTAPADTSASAGPAPAAKKSAEKKAPAKKAPAKKVTARKPAAARRTNGSDGDGPGEIAVTRGATWDLVELPFELGGSDDDTTIKETAYLPTALTKQLTKGRTLFTLERDEWVEQAGGAPGVAAFHEGLCWLGLAHIDDPDLIRLIPPDGRSSKDKRGLIRVPAGSRPAKPGRASLIGDLDWAAGIDDPRKKDTLRVTQSLSDGMAEAQQWWSLAHREWRTAYSRPPGASAFREGLLRLGLKHINDPRLMEYLPHDRRRTT